MAVVRFDTNTYNDEDKYVACLLAHAAGLRGLITVSVAAICQSNSLLTNNELPTIDVGI